MERYKKKTLTLIILLILAILSFEFFFCNATFIGSILKFNFDISLYTFSFARIFIYALFFVILYFIKNKIISNRIAYEESIQDKKNNFTKILLIVLFIFTLIISLILVFIVDITIMSVGIISLILIYILFLYLFHSNNYKLNILLICSLCFIYAISTISIHPIDEMIHFSSAYNISQGNFDFTKSYSDSNLDRINAWGNFNSNKDLHVHYNKDKYQVKEKTERWPSDASKFLYIPSATGIFISELLDGTIMDAFYIGRIFNALVLMIGIAILLKVIPFKINCFVAVITTPFFLLMGSTYNVDGIGVIAILIFIAYVLKLYSNKKLKYLTNKNIISLLILMLIIILYKDASYFLVFCILFLLRKKLSKKNMYILIPTFMIMLYLIYWQIVPSSIDSGDSRGGDTNMMEQLSFLLSSPLIFCKVYLLHTLNTFFTPGFYGELNNSRFFGEFSNYLVLIYIFYLLFMGLSSDDKMLNIKEKALVFIVSCLVFYFTSTGLYLSFTPVGEFIIKGYQARYVWPVIPLLLMLLSNKKIRIVNSYKLSFNCSLIITFLFLYSALYYQIVI